ncbi:TetR/AcrR family transcriptional regulator [Bowmanella pacifica]|uniref:TetR family transcriptional regulator n=1 Tax=Bowmanella pacifica TaxID=502051 RepID=A0A917YX34_9ALTE|nr:TetR/AcrR family transcriptional regulator [Bowmanella pacifica]GGO68365.1 TetR family transcriptional regulator [Bowmanella pacifica]
MRRANTDAAKGVRRNQFLEAGLQEFFERGFSLAKMENIARRAGVSKGTLYLYFDSKQDLFMEIVSSVALPRVEMLEEILRQADDFEQALELLVSALPMMIQDSKLPMLAKVLIGDAFAFPEVIKRYRQDVIERALAGLTALIERGCEMGVLHTDNPYNAARLMVAPVIFSAIWAVVFEQGSEKSLDLPSLFQTHKNMLLKALKA